MRRLLANLRGASFTNTCVAANPAGLNRLKLG